MEPTTLELTSVTNSWSSTTSSMPTMTPSRVEFDSKSLGSFNMLILRKHNFFLNFYSNSFSWWILVSITKCNGLDKWRWTHFRWSNTNTRIGLGVCFRNYFCFVWKFIFVGIQSLRYWWWSWSVSRQVSQSYRMVFRFKVH